MGLAAVARLLLYVIAGGLAGFLLLGEFALATFIPVLAVLAALAVLSLIAALRGDMRLSLWGPFLLAAMVTPLMINLRVVGLPNCTDVHAGIACFAGTRDVWTPFWLELLIFGLAAVASVVHLRRAARSLWVREGVGGART